MLPIMLILGLILFGMLVGAGAQLILGKSAKGVDWTLALVAGLVGSFVGGLVISLLSGDGLQFRPSDHRIVGRCAAGRRWMAVVSPPQQGLSRLTARGDGVAALTCLSVDRPLRQRWCSFRTDGRNDCGSDFRSRDLDRRLCAVVETQSWVKCSRCKNSPKIKAWVYGHAHHVCPSAKAPGNSFGSDATSSSRNLCRQPTGRPHSERV